MKSRSKNRAPNIVNLTVKRRYLTEREVERLMDCACKYGRYGHRDATMILVAYRHGRGLRIRFRALRANQSYWLPPPHPARRRGCQDAFPDPPTHAAPCLWVQARQTMATTRGPGSTTSGTRTSSTRSATPSFRPTGLR